MKYTLLLFLLSLSSLLLAQEICDNGLDDDGDGLIDLNDSDCDCNGIDIYVPESLFPNPSFEILSDPSCAGGGADANCAQGWLNPSDEGTPDFGFGCPDPISVFFPDVPCPVPNGDYYLGIADYENWVINGQGGVLKEYVGTELTSPVVVGERYVLSFWIGYAEANDPAHNSNAIEFVVYGNTSTSAMPFRGRDCPTNATVGVDGIWINPWQTIESVQLTAEFGIWKQYQVEFTPSLPFASVLLGPSCNAAVGQNYYFIDHLVLSRQEEFDIANDFIRDNGEHPCSGDLTLSVPDLQVNDLTYQWYVDGIAIAGATADSFIVPALPEGAGSYECVLTTSNGCSKSDPYLVQSTGAAPELTVPNGICPGDTLEVTVMDLYDAYAWSHTNENTPNSTITTPGDVMVTVTDADGCIFADTATIDAYDQVVYTVQVTPETTPGSGDGIIVIDFDPSLANPRVLWSDGRSDNPRTDFSEGTHCVEVMADEACAAEDCIDVPLDIQPIDISYLTTPVRCRGEANATIRVEVTGGREPLTWTWSNGASDQSTYLEGLTSGTYRIEVTDADGQTTAEDIVIPAVDPIIVEVDIRRPTCFGSNDGRMSVFNALGGHDNFEYQWNNGPFGLDDNITGLAAGPVRLTVRDGEGCTWDRQLVMDEPTPLSASIEVEHAACASTEDGAIFIDSIRGGSPGYDIFINGQATDANIFDLAGERTYSVTISDALGCRYEQNIFLSNLTDFSVSMIMDTTVERYLDFVIQSSSTHDVVEYHWQSTSGEDLLCSDCNVFIGKAEASSWIYLTAESIDGCRYTDSLYLEVTPSKRLYIPTAISPNGDGINDGFEVLNSDYVESVRTLKVINGQGASIFHGQNSELPVMLEALNSQLEELELPMGQYVYFIDLVFRDGTIDRLSGEFAIIR